MKLLNKNAEIYIPDEKDMKEALSRTTHMTIAAHQDDIEIMAYEGIADCFGRSDKWHLGVVATNGAGSPRSGIYADYTDDEMKKIRKEEQKKAAYIGKYSAQILLDYPSSQLKDKNDCDVIEDIKELIKAAKPEIIYTHNLADKHDTHVGTAVKVIKALRKLEDEYLPEKLLSCEVWRDLDWVPDKVKIIMDVDKCENLAEALLGVFDSQICGGKRYDLAAISRRIANATFSSSHAADKSSAISYAIDLTPLIHDKNIDIAEYIGKFIQNFMDEVVKTVSNMC